MNPTNPLQKRSGSWFEGLASTPGTTSPMTSDTAQRSKIDGVGRPLIGARTVDHSDEVLAFKARRENPLLSQFKQIRAYTPDTVNHFFDTHSSMSGAERVELLTYLFEAKKDSIQQELYATNCEAFKSIEKLESEDAHKFLEGIVSVKDVTPEQIRFFYTNFRSSEYVEKFSPLSFGESLLKTILQSDFESVEKANLIDMFYSNDLEMGFASNFCQNNLDFLAQLTDKDTVRLFFANANRFEEGFYGKILAQCPRTQPELLVRFYEFSPTHYSIDDRFQFAEKAADSTTLAEKILVLFSNQEIVEHHDRILQLFDRSKEHSDDLKLQSYLDKTMLYVEHLVSKNSNPEHPASSTENSATNKTPEIYELVKRITDEKGDSHRIYRMRDEYDENNLRKHTKGDISQFAFNDNKQELFPATVSSPNDIKELLTRPEFRELGFELEDGSDETSATFYSNAQGGNGTFFTFPEPAILVKRWNELRLREPERQLPEFKIKIVDYDVSVEEFNRAFENGEIIVDVKGELLHDTTVHVITNIYCMLTSDPNDYKNCWDKAIQFHKNARHAIEFAGTNNLNEVPPEMLHILVTTTGIFADGFTNQPTHELREELIRQAFGFKDEAGVHHFEEISMPEKDWGSGLWSNWFGGEPPFTANEINKAWIKVLQDYAFHVQTSTSNSFVSSPLSL